MLDYDRLRLRTTNTLIPRVWYTYVYSTFVCSLIALPTQSAIAHPIDSSNADLHSRASTDVVPVLDDDHTRSNAEKIAELQALIGEDEKQLEELDQGLKEPNGEYAKAEQAFRELNSEVEKTHDAIREAKAANRLSDIPDLESELESLQNQRKIAEARFELAIEDRKTMREERATLRSKIDQDRQALAALTGESDESEVVSESRDPSHERTHVHSVDDSDAHHEHGSKDKVVEEGERDEELIEAEAEAKRKEEEAETAKEETKSLASRMSELQKLVGQEQKELSLARRRAEITQLEQRALEKEFERLQSDGGSDHELSELAAKMADANRRLESARSDITEVGERLIERRAELSDVQAEHIVALHEVELKRRDAQEAEQRVESLRNPFTARNILQWIIEHGPKMLVILISMFLANRFAMFFASRSVRLVTSGAGRGTTAERENRARTLVGVFQNATTVAIFITGILMMLDEAGANITVLMGGVAVVGLAVAFGAQNLIKDYFYGFVMLLESQYMLNDTVRIGTVSGQVERITLRMTVLRDSNGIVHFIPNGTINSVSNETHGWSRAVCEIAIGYEDDVDRLMDELNQIATKMFADSEVGKLILEQPAEPSIESLGESSITIKTAFRTMPNKHGVVKQEWLKRTRRRFAELGVTPPYPQRIFRVETADGKNGSDRKNGSYDNHEKHNGDFGGETRSDRFAA